MRGGIVDVFPSTADSPVRIDLWGDEVDRLTRFDVADQRSVEDLARVELFGCREVVLDEVMRKRAAHLVGAEPWGRQQWERLADGMVFDGMESWLPWLVEGEEVLCDLLGDDALVVLVEPRRVRDRAGELLEEEAALAEALASTWGLEAGRSSTAPAPVLRSPAQQDRCRGGLAGPLGGLARHPQHREPRLGAHPGRRGQARRPGRRLGRGRVHRRALRPEPGCGRATGWRAGRRRADRPGRSRRRRRTSRGGRSRRARRTRRPHRGGHGRPGLRPSWLPGWPFWPSRTSPDAGVPIARPGPGPGPRTASSTTWHPAATSSTASTAWPSTGAWSPAPWPAPPATTSSSSTGAVTGSTCPPTRST